MDSEHTTTIEPVGQEELTQLLTTYSQVTDRLKSSYEQLQHEVRGLREELASKNRQLARRERLAALGEMAAGLAHEIRNPLGGISLYASVLQRELTDREDLLTIVGKISRGVASLESLVADVLAFTNKVHCQAGPVDLGALVEETAEMTLSQCSSAVRIDIAESTRGRRVWVDENLFRRALLNLMLNASQACGDDGTIRVSCRRRGSHDVVVVEDDGPGIETDVVDRIFNPFFTTKSTGTGLGLTIVHRIVEAHGGVISATNRRSGGARFSIRLPGVEAAVESHETAGVA